MMNKKEFLHLKSGTDVRGTAVETAEHGVQLTDETVQKICVGFYKWYCRKEQVDTFGIAVGQDCRISSPRIAAAAMAAFCACGCRVFDCGLATTPSMFMSIVENEPVQTALEITASHHPFDRNGLKFFTSGGGLEGEDVSAILELAYDAEVPAGTDNAPVVLPFMNDYAALLRQQIVDGVQNGDRPLEGLHIVVDAGNGVGGFYADQVLAPLGADVSGSQFLEPDGMFPNHIPNPENKGAIDAASKMVLDSSADLGLIFDTDVDRMGCIGATGQEINFSPNDIQRLVQNAPAGTNLTQLIYRQMLTGNKAFKELFRALEAGETPILFHCTAGKDRTGVAAMLILLALGASDETICADYARTNLCRAAEIEKAMADHAAEIAADPAQRMRWQSSAGVDPETAPFVLRTIRQDYGSAESYLEAEYGLTPARLMRLRRMYLE